MKLQFNEKITFGKNWNRKMFKITTLIALVLFIFCETANTNNNTTTNNNNNVNFDIGNHLSMYEKFKTNEPYSYSYIYSHSGFYSVSVKVYITDGVVDSVVLLDTLHQSAMSNNDQYLIDSFFVSIENDYNNNNGIDVEEKDIYTTAIECNYNEDYYFPTNWDFDYHYDPDLEVDFICNFKIDSFTILKD